MSFKQSEKKAKQDEQNVLKSSLKKKRKRKFTKELLDKSIIQSMIEE